MRILDATLGPEAREMFQRCGARLTVTLARGEDT
jgi:hypothetical protein